MLTASQLKEHVLNRVGYGPTAWASDRYDQLGMSSYVSEQLGQSLPPMTRLGTTPHTKISRSILEQRQLEVTLLDFWFNHFNVDSVTINEEARQNFVIGRTIDSYQNDDIVPHIMGDFGEMLLATAKAPAMLFYLDNRINYEEETINGITFGGNDNYAREVMELHTIGVDGGYNEFDITEAARILTGWSVSDDQYIFRTQRHDFNAKTVMGVDYPVGGGEEEGVAFLDWLANHPAAANFLAGKLVARFVNEDPPSSVTAAAAAAYGANRDLAATTSAILNHPDFVDPANFRAKIKPPHRYVISGVAAMGADRFADWEEILVNLVWAMFNSGEFPYLVSPPTGYPEESAHWVSGTSMVERFEIAKWIAEHPPLVSRLIARSGTDGTDVMATVDAVTAVMLPGGLNSETREAILDFVANAGSNQGRIMAAARMILCSPEFLRF